MRRRQKISKCVSGNAEFGKIVHVDDNDVFFPRWD